jgi:hypothetical protein
MLGKRYRLKLATWTVVREPGQPSPRRLSDPESVAALAQRLATRHYLRRIPRSVITSNRPVSSCSKREAR